MTLISIKNVYKIITHMQDIPFHDLHFNLSHILCPLKLLTINIDRQSLTLHALFLIHKAYLLSNINYHSCSHHNLTINFSLRVYPKDHQEMFRTKHNPFGCTHFLFNKLGY